MDLVRYDLTTSALQKQRSSQLELQAQLTLYIVVFLVILLPIIEFYQYPFLGIYLDFTKLVSELFSQYKLIILRSLLKREYLYLLQPMFL